MLKKIDMGEFVEIFPWNKNFETGIAKIDEQHQMLAELLNQLANHLSNDWEINLLDKTFVELVDYAAYHLQSEERILEEVGATNFSLNGHKKIHEKLIKNILKLKEREESKPVQEVIKDVLSFLTHWLAHHILDSDLRMSKVVLAMKTGLSLEYAQQQEIKNMAAVLDDTYDHLCERTVDLKREINSHKEAKDKLQLLGKIFDESHDGIVITDSNKKIIDVNPAFSEITGYPRDEVIGENPRILRSGKQSPEFYDDMRQAINQRGKWQGEIRNRKKGGELYIELLTISSLTDDNGKVVRYVGVFSDITARKKQQEELNLISQYDVLTGLPNRSLFTDRFHQALAHSKCTKSELAICFLDIDNFKYINDNYGHDIGDQLLVQVAQRIKANIREDDTVSRQGGDEFAILLGNLESLAQCEKTIERIHRSLSQPFIISNNNHEITASTGVTVYPSDNSEVDTLLRHADQAMYQSKQLGRNCYHLFNTKQDQETIHKHHRLSEIEYALINNEFCLYYQPKVNMVTGEVFGVEALIRWIHPEQGLVPPLEFLPIIEGTDLEIKVGDWVIEQALMQLEKWQEHEIMLEISVNIASHHLLSETFFLQLDYALEKHPTVSSNFLQLEILESSTLGDINSINNIIKTCQNVLGVNVALDDFGTGYSSLTHLRNLPANMIKIDQSFVRDMLDDPSDCAIIDGVIGLADAFGRDVIAEGVETTEHGLMLIIMGCEKAQGYGIARPMPEKDIPDWLIGYKPNQYWLFCGNKHRTTKENKVKLFKLICERWQNNFVSNLKSPPKNIENWPIMDDRHCLCCYWLKRARKEQLFEQRWLDELDESHKSIHITANALLFKYQDGNVDAAREGVDELQTVFHKISNILNILSMCE